GGSAVDPRDDVRGNGLAHRAGRADGGADEPGGLMERLGGEVAWEGRIVKVRVDRFRYDDGEEAEREVVEHPGAVGIVAHDGERLYLVKQPREAVNEPALLELP